MFRELRGKLFSGDRGTASRGSRREPKMEVLEARALLTGFGEITGSLSFTGEDDLKVDGSAQANYELHDSFDFTNGSFADYGPADANAHDVNWSNNAIYNSYTDQFIIFPGFNAQGSVGTKDFSVSGTIDLSPAGELAQSLVNDGITPTTDLTITLKASVQIGGIYWIGHPAAALTTYSFTVGGQSKDGSLSYEPEFGIDNSIAELSSKSAHHHLGETIGFSSDFAGNKNTQQFSFNINVTVSKTPVNPDLAATSLAWDTAQGGVDYGYTISGGDLQQPTTIDLDWASGTTPDTIIGNPIVTTTTNTAQGTYNLHATPSQLATVPSGARYLLAVVDPNNDVTPADPSKVASLALSSLMVTTQPPNIVGLDDNFDVQVSEEDANGNVDTSFNGPVTIALDNNPGGATLGGTLTVNAVNGVADFPDLTLNKAGSGYTLKATSAGMTSVDTGSFTVAYIVTNTSDSGPGSLSDMITAVDADPIANGPDQITFAGNISGANILLQSPLPALTRDQVTITGPITLDGTSAGGDGLDISGNQDSVQNVTVKSFSGNGISVTGNNDFITGSQITGNQNGIVVSGGATGNTIGGTAAGAGNVITSNSNDGIALDNAQQTVIQGNWIGTDASSTLGLGNGNDGIEISDGATGNTIGGTVAGAGNVIAANTSDGIVLDNAQQTLIQGNWVGTDSSGDSDVGNGAVGILIEDGASDNTIGLMPTDTTTPVDQNPTANVIAFNGETGVVITGDGTIDNVVRGNPIYGNGPSPSSADGYTYNSGIDLRDDGRTLNTYPQSTATSDANGGQNFPTSSLVKQGGDQTEVIGTLKSLPSTSFTLDFYVNPSTTLQDVRQGRIYLGSAVVTTDASGFAPFDVTLNQATDPDMGITATATGPNGTSEIEFMYTRPVLVVPGILGSLPDNADFASWLTQRGFDPSKLLPDPLGNSYADLTTSLVNYGYVLGQTLFVATYDWRMPVAPLDSSGNLVPLSGMGIADDLTNKQYNSGVDYLAYWLEQAATEFNAQYLDIPLDSVDVIAHSMGGLVVRAYIQSSAYGDDVPWELATTKLPKINDFTMIGTPNLGAPQSFNPSQNNWEINNGGLTPVLNNIAYEYVFSSIIEMAVKELEDGYMIGGPTINSSITLNQVNNPDGTLNYYQFISRYVPSLFDLMSTQPFLYNGSRTGPVTVNDNPLIRNNLLLDLNAPDGNGGSGLTDFESMVEQVNVIYGSGLSTDISSTAEIGPIDNSVGIPIRSVFPFDTGHPQVPSTNQPWYLDQFAPNGDGTVPASAADPFEGITTVRTFNVGAVEHQALPSDPLSQTVALQSLGLNTSLDSISTSLSYSGPRALATWEIQYRIDPVGTVLTDDQGRPLGDTPETGPLEEIPDSVFLGDSSTGIGIAFGTGPVPTQLELVGLGQSYSVSILGYDSSGEFGNSLTGTLASGQTQVVPLTDQSGEQETITDLASSSSPSTYGQSVTFTATVSSMLPAGDTPTGEIQFIVDGSDLGLPVSVQKGQASSPAVSILGAGAHSIEAVFAGQGPFLSSTDTVSQYVNPAQLTVVADDQSMNHYDAVPTLTYHYAGFVGSDNATNSGIVASVMLATTATSSSPAGYYAIVPTVNSFSAPNYTIGNIQNGTLTVLPKVLDVRLDYGSKSISLIGLNRDLPFTTIKAIDIIFSDNVAVNMGQLSLTDANISSHGFSGFSYNPVTDDATWTLPSAIGVDHLMMALDGETFAANPTIGVNPFATKFAVLPGDINGDGVVNAQDMVLARNAMLDTGDPSMIGWADLDGNGVVDINDYNAVRKNIGKHL